jgi:predicted O-methyltransferase YrrM
LLFNIDSFVEAVKFYPKYRSNQSAWLGHAPFACWLIQNLKPKIFVELGTHHGDSYFAFCQVISESGLNTKCFAVDSWAGDKHTKIYEDEIYPKVKSFNDDNFSSFSNLEKRLLNDAISLFEDRSIDLLHIDNLHTYEAVKNIFNSWLPKMAPGGVILFHDTQVFRDDFGVHRLWNELTQDYRNSINFEHCNGLGVLQIDGEANPRLNLLGANSDLKKKVVEYFSAIGGRFEEAKELFHQLNDVWQMVKKAEDQLSLIRLQKEIESSNLNSIILEKNNYIDSLNEMILKNDGLLATKNILLTKTIADIYASRSWKITSSLRRVVNFFRQIHL